MFDRIKRAWAVWMLANSSYGCKLDGGFGFDRIGGASKKLNNKRINFSIDYAVRLQQVQVECCDAPRIIKSRDTAGTFFYLDPPYVGSDQGHYDGYTQEDFNALLEILAHIRGKFLLSSFRNKALAEFSRRNKWEAVEVKMACPMSNKYKASRAKIEVLTANYPILAGENS
ncbi:MAG: DNA adenine methylase [Treponema sp.]|jgi:DNA adenine methylase|nr:DNA adenine methylase [Treponema sp.]